MKIGIISPSLRFGGAERVASQLMGYLAERHECYSILFDSADRAFPVKGNLIDLNLPEPGRKSLPIRLKNTLRAVSKLSALKRDLNLDVAVSFLEPANIPNVLAKGPDRTRTILTIHEDKGHPESHALQRRISDFMIRRVYGQADRIITVSQGSRKTLIDRYHLKESLITVIYNPVDIDSMRALADESLAPWEEEMVRPPTIVSLGRLTLAKGHWHLIRAFTQIRQAVPEARLVLLGDGELKGQLMHLAKALGLSGSVFFPGFQSNPFKFVSRASVCAFSSLWEGFGNAICESLGLGIPVVSTDVRSGPREILAPDTDFQTSASDIEWSKFGVLVPAPEGKRASCYSPNLPLTRSEGLLAGAVIRLLTESKLAQAYSRQGPARANDFQAQTLLPQYEKVLQEVVDG